MRREAPPGTLQVPEAAARLNGALKGAGPMTVQGEVRNHKFYAGSGHRYFSLVKGKATLPAVLFAQRSSGIEEAALSAMKDGVQAVISGRANFYAPFGKAQLIVEDLFVLAPMGERERILREREQRLENEGLFDPNLKRPFPMMPMTVSVIGSAESSALRDVQKVHQRLCPDLPVQFLAARTQGESAAQELANALRQVQGECALLIRGGGATEDLDAYREEIVVRAVRACPAPVATGIGHETDTTLADRAADMHRATPTAAAEFAFPDAHALMATLEAQGGRVRTAMTHGLTLRRQSLQNAGERLPKGLAALCRRKGEALQAAGQRFRQSAQNRLSTLQQRARLAKSRLELLSPLRPLERGYALVQTKAGKAVKSAKRGARLKNVWLRFHDGRLQAIPVPPAELS